ncbi:hypothetical protein DOY81_011049, partial [Sarcophaga bullata]
MSVKKSPKSLNSPPTSTTNNFEQLQLRSSGDMSASAAASAAAIALALDLKPKHPIISDTQQQLHQLQQQAAQLQHPQHQQHQQQQPQPQHQQQQKIKKCAFRSKPYKQRPFTRSLNRKILTKISCKSLNSTPKTPNSFNPYPPLENPCTLLPPPLPSPSPSPSANHLLTKENFLFTLDLLAVVRRNASDKLKLIQMVHDNPILWDSRLPNFKGAEEEKNRAWEQIGKEFNAPGRRVARAFKSLRESYRRELAHVKLMGNNFKPKWSLYDAMDFLRDVIRERNVANYAMINDS